jgi:hypothetical protein
MVKEKIPSRLRLRTWQILSTKYEILNNIKVPSSNDQNMKILNFEIRIWDLFRI